MLPNKTLPVPKPCFLSYQNVIIKQQWLMPWSHDNFPSRSKSRYRKTLFKYSVKTSVSNRSFYL